MKKLFFVLAIAALASCNSGKEGDANSTDTTPATTEAAPAATDAAPTTTSDAPSTTDAAPASATK